MSASSLVVVANSLRLRRFTPRTSVPGRRRTRGDRRRAGSVGGGHGWLGELARSAAGPVICGTVLIGLLAAWAAAGGAGTLTRVRLEITVAAVPMRAFTPRAAAAAGDAHTSTSRSAT